MMKTEKGSILNELLGLPSVAPQSFSVEDVSSVLGEEESEEVNVDEITTRCIEKACLICSDKLKLARIFPASRYPSSSASSVASASPRTVVFVTIYGLGEPILLNTINEMFPQVDIHWKSIFNRTNIHLADNSAAMLMLQSRRPQQYTALNRALSEDLQVQALLAKKDVVGVITSAILSQQQQGKEEVAPALRVMVIDPSIYDFACGPIPATISLESMGGLQVAIEIVEGWFFFLAGSGGKLGSAITAEGNIDGYGTIGPMVQKEGKQYVATCEHVANEATAHLSGPAAKAQAQFVSPGKCRKVFDMLEQTDFKVISTGGKFATGIHKHVLSKLVQFRNSAGMKALLQSMDTIQQPVTLDDVHVYLNQGNINIGQKVTRLASLSKELIVVDGDVALVEVSSPVVRDTFSLRPNPDASAIAGAYTMREVEDLVPLQVSKQGASTGLTMGTIGPAQAAMKYDHESVSLLTPDGKTRVISNVYLIHPSEDALFAAKGDSGSCVYVEQGNSMYVVGILLGTSNHNPPFYAASSIDVMLEHGYSQQKSIRLIFLCSFYIKK